MTKFQQEYAKLNKAQKEAVEQVEGPVMVIAGPGTGKTQILAMRIANILNKTQVNPSNILCLTFTNSGVFAMRKRLLEIIGKSSYAVHIHTFHSFCNEIINQFPEKFIFSSKINQLLDLEQVQLIQKIIADTDLKLLKPLKSPYFYQKDILKAIADLKQEGIHPVEFLEILKKEKTKFDADKNDIPKAKAYEQENTLIKNFDLQKIYAKYQEVLQQEGYYDYNDMILLVLESLKTDPELLSFYQEKFQYILVDEYQDTNSSQNEILKILGSFYPDPNIFVVGDDEQSIFRFQGASLENLLFFVDIYPNTKVIILKENYRSGQKILDTTRALIKNNTQQIQNILKLDKSLRSTQQIKSEIHIGEFVNSDIESYFIASKIKDLIKLKIKPSEIAVIYKEHRDAEEITEYLDGLKIPYYQEAGENILEDFEIQKLLKILKVIQGFYKKENDALMFEVMHFSFWKIDVLDLYKLINFSSRNKIGLFELLHDENNLKKINLKKKKSFKKFIDALTYCANSFKNHTFSEGLQITIEKSGFLDFILKKEDAVILLNRLKGLFDQIKLLNIKNKRLNIDSFLTFIEDLEKNNLQVPERFLDIDFQGVKLMTAHKSKGMEFEYVFIPKLIDGHWGQREKKRLIKLPTGILKTIDSKSSNEEEERRLFYVALTRTKREIFLSFALSYKESEEQLRIPSQFLGELPLNKLARIDSQKYSKDFKRLKLIFQKETKKPQKEMRQFITDLVNKFSLSSTSLNAYLECPVAFFYNQILRVPKVKDFSLSYGSAVHKALEMFYRKFMRDGILPKKEFLISLFRKAINEEIFTPQELRVAQKEGSVVLETYYDFYKSTLKKEGPPINVEYNFSSHNVFFDNIPITGKIDKIQLINSIDNTIRITDYKTSKPKTLNQLLGKTKNANKNELYQAYFYKLLSEEDPQFTWRVKEIVFDFVSVDKGSFKKVTVPIDKKEYDRFKEIVKETYLKIKRLDFSSPQNLKTCRKWNKTCEYFDLCNKSDKIKL